MRRGPPGRLTPPQADHYTFGQSLNDAHPLNRDAMATIPLAAPARRPITVEAFHRMGEAGILAADDRVELIDGEIIDMSPIGALHAALVDALVRHFGRHAGDAVVVRCQNPLRLDDVNQPEPDVAVLGTRPDFYTTAHPGPADVRLLVEVADTSLAYDLGVKVPLYARHGIPEVWVIDVATRRTTLFRRPTDGRYADESRVEPDGPLSCDAVTTAAGGRLEVVLTRLLPPLA